MIACGSKLQPPNWASPAGALNERFEEIGKKLFVESLFGLRVADAFPIFLSKYPTYHPAYVPPHPKHHTGVAAIISYSPTVPSMTHSTGLENNIEGVIAHEIAHVFGAPDEYGIGSRGNVTCLTSNTAGFFETPNTNCALITAPTSTSPPVLNPTHGPCLMDQNVRALCNETPRHLGWVDDDSDTVPDLHAQAEITKVFRTGSFGTQTRICQPGETIDITGRNVWDTQFVLFNDEVTNKDISPKAPDHVTVKVPRPIAPVVRSVVPAFTWEEERDDDLIIRRRLGNRVRFELARPWLTTGEGESLAVIVPAADSPSEAMQFVSQMDRDPIWVTSDPLQFPALDGDVVKLSENGANVQAVPSTVWRHGDSWYADVFVPETGSYSALARFAVARYQPNSLDGLELSAVVHTDWVPLLPDRTLVLDMSERNQGRITATLSGTIVQGPTANRIDVIVEQNPNPSVITDLVSRDHNTTDAWQIIAEFNGTIDETIAVDSIPLDGSIRLRAREVETISSGGTSNEPELAERTVYTDIISL